MIKAQTRKNETPIKYSRRLLGLVNQLTNPQYMTDADGAFETQTQSFQFGSNELAGLKIFLTEGGTGPLSAETIQNGKVGNCVICHTPPAFSDFLFHNTGATQEEYDSIHGDGAFAQVFVPTLAQRSRTPDAYLPASADHPNATGQFITPPSTNHPGFVDLGLWNEFRNPDQARPQHQMLQILNKITGVSDPNRALVCTIALFKTAGLRDLSQSGPYLHTARKDSLEEAVQFYKDFSGKSRAGIVRNGAAECGGIALTDDDITSLAAFLRALNEDYD